MNLPKKFELYTRTLIGNEEYDLLEKALGEPSSVSIRLNTKKTTSKPKETKLVPWASDAYYLNNRPAFTFDPLFHTGSYYVQEASSMFLEQALKTCVKSAVVALDLCAAPGGKSTLIRSILPEGSLLVANEPMRQRAQILAENLTKWGHPDVLVTNNFPADFKPLKEMFDLIATDVPCSGEGMFRKDEQAITEWSIENVELCAARQREILAHIWSCLKPGGYLIYSTCTFNVYEDEENVAWIIEELGAELVQIETKPEWGILGDFTSNNHSVYHFLPHHAQGEGFFLALLRKEGEYANTNKEKKRNKGGVQTIGLPKECKQWIEKAAEFAAFATNNGICAIHKSLSETVMRISATLRIITAGIPLAEEKGGCWTPQHGLSMSTCLQASAFQRVEVSRIEAIAYLRKEAICLPPETPRGFILITYKGTPLGFTKNIGNRANNLYPNEWRIRSGYTPSDTTEVLE
ncbi:MAG: rRNA cytosine-C5-methyltransferase [Bacteroidaceae bacterium]